MRFRRSQPDQRRQVVPPLLWVRRVSYRLPSVPETETGRAVYRERPAVAPVSWPVQIALLGLNAWLAAYLAPLRGRRLFLRGAPLIGTAGLIQYQVPQAAGRRRAAQLGLRYETTPVPKADIVTALIPLAWALFVRVRGWKISEPRWPRLFAQQFIQEVERRRAWNAALRAGGRDRVAEA